MTAAANDKLEALLHRFAVESDDLRRLEERLHRFNIFDALGIARMELRHSNFLGWLLNPRDSHQAGDSFCRAVLADMLRSMPADQRPSEFETLETTNLGAVEVRREWRHIDLLLDFRDLDLLLVIENKIDSTEHSDQLDRYARTIASEFPGRHAIFVYLSATGETPSSEVWHPYSYADLHRALGEEFSKHRESLEQDVAAFLEHYLELVRTRFMKDSDLDALCKRIYMEHRQAIDIIVERARAGSSELLNRIAEQLRAESDQWQVVSDSGAKWLGLTLADWGERLPPIGTQRAYLGSRWILIWFAIEEDALTLSLWTHETSDEELRRAVVNYLWENDAKYGIVKARRSHAKLYTVHRESIVADISQYDEPDLIVELAASRANLLAERLSDLPEVVAKVQESLGRPVRLP